jgi:signal transduction histidine kinase
MPPRFLLNYATRRRSVTSAERSAKVITMSSGPSRWLRDIAIGYYRSAVLVAVAGAIPALTAVVGVFGLYFTRSWSAELHAAFLVRLVAAVGEWALAAWWTVLVFGMAMTVLGRPAGQFLRRHGGRWLGGEIPSPYRPPRPITKMSTGYWWDGYGYQESEREARFHAWFMGNSVVASIRGTDGDPQLRRDVVWQVVAAITVVPVAALPLVFGAGAIYAAVGAQSVPWLVLLAAGSLISAPFAWKIFAPVGPRYLAAGPDAAVEREVARLQSIRADLTQTQAAELERIERSLHDGAQAGLVALGMHLSVAEGLVDKDPERTKQILRDARASSAIALDQLRTLVRGINPPVLVERGLADAIRALALDAPIEVDVRSYVAGRPEQPIEAAIYFAVAELLANVVKHSHASAASIDLSSGDGVLRAVVSDDGIGGATAASGSGLDGIGRRVAAFEGQMHIDSPAGGPTRVTLTVPCELS